MCVNTPIFFSRNHGLISISSNDPLPDLNVSQTVNSQMENSFNETAGNLTIYNLDPDEIYNAYKDTLGQFKAAFIFHVKRQLVGNNTFLKLLFTHFSIRFEFLSLVF